ncbi:xanthine dehydrogenase family protein molybdopterin-binding subunit [Pseudohoeflea coraliihabitans]|uniref:Molybdopterin-dependent oxidoreductase n=1 Tax=Pseudohoeflea coraliihabitans TaxID=2860393 RepID=A0ABS6WLL8_9HYPH|nr:molybdopterin cofactor-binding domain-containing protein [Pseudohoeflea sp. DP4N28-3]MBW3096665.1 molybdopterin-dependent oxidoreductase [Pseudohoeflea sp. DP4N28-3]
MVEEASQLAMLRVEDAPLLTGRGRFFDDLPAPRGTLEAAILRSPHAHARITSMRCDAARALKGVHAVITGEDYARVASPLMVGVKLPIQCWPIARDKVRYTGEPIAVVLAEDRYIAEDALDLIEVDFDVLAPALDPLVALNDDAPVLHEEMGGNLGSERSFTYGDPEAAFAAADQVVEVSVRYPRNSCTPIETYGVLTEWNPHDQSYEVTANFQGPFSIHPVIARALNVPGNRLRLKTPEDSGGSFGVKQGVFPYIALLGACARLADRPVRWVEDRLEHLTASVSATNRAITLRAAVTATGRVTALDFDQVEDVGAYLRAPEPATLYRMHGNLCGAYDIANLSVRNRIVMTNKTPTGLNRGFGGPQLYFALERLMQRIAGTLGLDPLEVIRTNLIAAEAFPYRTASGATYDSGDYAQALERALTEGDYEALLARRDTARAEGRLYGIGLTAAVEPSVSNMGYLSTALTPAERAKAGPKNGAQSCATIAIDPVGSITVQIDSVPQGQGHKTVAAGIVAERFGLNAGDVRVVAAIDTSKDAWSIAAGNYSSRFAAASAGAVSIAADRLRQRIARIAAAQLNVTIDDIRFADGKVFSIHNPDAAVSFSRVASAAHWAPATLPEGIASPVRETAIWTAPELAAPTEDDRINSSLCHAFIFDFCGIEIDPVTCQVRIDRYVTMHDCGTILHQGMVDGQIRGAFAQAVGAALFEEYAYDEDGAFLAGTLADYPVPTIHEIPDLQILHTCSPSPLTPLGAKGVGEGNCMSTPVCIANAVADALAPAHGPLDLTLPLSPTRIAALLSAEPPAPAGQASPRKPDGKGLSGQGQARVSATPQEIWDLLMDADQLAALIPGAHGVKQLSPTRFIADVTLGVGPVKGRYRVDVGLSDLNEPHSAVLTGKANGALGSGSGTGTVTLVEDDGGTVISYSYEAAVGGKVAAVGGRLLDGAAKIVIGQFFTALGRKAGGDVPRRGLLARLRARWGASS